MVINSQRLSNDLAKLISNNYRKKAILRNFHPNSYALRRFTKGCIEGAMKRGVCEFLYQDKQLKAFFLLLYTQLAPGLPFYRGFVQTDQSKESEKWVIEKLETQSSFFTENSMMDFPHYLKHLLPQVYLKGYFIDSVRTVGRPKEAYANLMKFRNPKNSIDGCTIEKIKNKNDLKQIQKIEFKEFKRNPQYGWFVSSKPWLDNQYKLRFENLKNPEAFMRVIKKGKKVLGYFGYSAQAGIFNGKNAGIEFVFDKSIQGKGFSLVGYRIMLENMIEKNIDFFMGNTSQPSVLKAAKIMGRVPQNYVIRFGKSFFQAKHFDHLNKKF